MDLLIHQEFPPPVYTPTLCLKLASSLWQTSRRTRTVTPRVVVSSSVCPSTSRGAPRPARHAFSSRNLSHNLRRRRVLSSCPQPRCARWRAHESSPVMHSCRRISLVISITSDCSSHTLKSKSKSKAFVVATSEAATLLLKLQLYIYVYIYIYIHIQAFNVAWLL